MSDELKPCPFCGGEACYVDDIGMGVDEPTKEISCEHISCLPITVRVPISSWNARPIEDALRARAEKAEGELKENAQKQLLRCMRDFSEETYCAGWLLGIEDACRALVAGELKNGFGMLEPGDELDEWKQKMTDLHDRAGGWWKWDDTENKEVFVPDRWIP